MTFYFYLYLIILRLIDLTLLESCVLPSLAAVWEPMMVTDVSLLQLCYVHCLH